MKYKVLRQHMQNVHGGDGKHFEYCIASEVNDTSCSSLQVYSGTPSKAAKIRRIDDKITTSPRLQRRSFSAKTGGSLVPPPLLPHATKRESYVSHTNSDALTTPTQQTAPFSWVQSIISGVAAALKPVILGAFQGLQDSLRIDWNEM